MFMLATIIYLIVILFNLLISLFVLLKSKQQKIKTTYFILVFILNGWILNNYLSYFVNDYEIIQLTVHLAYLFGALIGPCFLLFCLYFPAKSKITNLYKFLIFFPPLVFSYLSFTDLFIKEHTLILNEPALPVYGDYLYIYGIYILFYLFLCFRLLFIKYRKSLPIEKVKILYIILSFFIASFIGVLVDLIFPYFIENSRSYWGSLGTIFISIAFAYSILKYRLLDIKIVLKKSLLHFSSIVILFFIYFYLLFLVKDSLVKNAGWSEQTTLIFIILIIVLTIEPLRKLILKGIDKLFYSENKEVQKQTEKLEMALKSNVQFESLINTIDNSLKKFLHVPSVRFVWLNKQTGKLESYKEENKLVLDSTGPVFQYLKSNPGVLVTEEIPYMLEEMTNGEKELLEKVEKKLKSLKVAMVLPIGETGELVGAFLFDKKQRNEAFTTENIEYLTELQPQMTGAIANAVFYKQAVDRITQV